MRPLVVLSLLVGLFPAIYAQQNSAPPPAASQAPVANPLPIEKQIRKTVAFIEMICTSGNQAFRSRGTGFFVFYPDNRLPNDQGYSYLVTNRHVAECWDEETLQPRTVQTVTIRLNRKDGHSEDLHYDHPGNVPWIFPADSSVDLAVLPLSLNLQTYDYMTVPLGIFADEGSLSEGDKIMLSGFFLQFPGVVRMQPIVREGILAMLPDEDLITTTGKPGRVYLADVHIFGGNSGSPVLADLGGYRGGALMLGASYKMVGVVSGMYYEDTDFKLQVTTTITGQTHGNSGIAMIVPAYILKTLLDDPRLQAKRDVNTASFLKDHPSATK